MNEIKFKPLKLCPFCNGEASTLNVVQHYMVHCKTCCAMVGLFDTLERAIEAWNRRS